MEVLWYGTDFRKGMKEQKESEEKRREKAGDAES
jgi:hypothetical protein